MLSGSEIVRKINLELDNRGIPKYKIADALGGNTQKSRQAKYQMVDRVLNRIQNAASIDLLQKIASAMDLSPEYFLYSNEEFTRLFAPKGLESSQSVEGTKSIYERFLQMSLEEMKEAVNVFKILLEDKIKSQKKK